ADPNQRFFARSHTNERLALAADQTPERDLTPAGENVHHGFTLECRGAKENGVRIDNIRFRMLREDTGLDFEVLRFPNIVRIEKRNQRSARGAYGGVPRTSETCICLADVDDFIAVRLQNALEIRRVRAAVVHNNRFKITEGLRAQ